MILLNPFTTKLLNYSSNLSILKISINTKVSLFTPIRIPRKSMQSSRGFLVNKATNVLRRHSYPIMDTRSYKGGTYLKPEHLYIDDKKPLSQHETTHALVFNDNMDEAYGVLTSAKQPKPNFTPHIISNENYSGEKKSQSFASFCQARQIDPNLVKENPKATAYLQNKELLLDQLTETVKNNPFRRVSHYTFFENIPKDEEIWTK
jgi:hypothetical protein